MNEKELFKLLKQMNLEVAYDHFTRKVAPPFLLYRNTDTTTYSADNHTYWLNKEFIVDLITDIKDIEKEEQLESIFNDNYLPFTKEEDFIESEQIYQIRYFI